MFTLTQLEGFVAVAEELHFGRAAERLSMTQPPLSRQIRLLETSMGVRLLDRTSRSVSLTPAGRTLLVEARRILRLSDETALAVRRVPSGESGSLVVGFTAASVHGPVTRLVSRLSEAHPHLDLVLRELVSADQLAALGAGDVDLGLLRPPIRGSGFHWRRVHEEPMVLATPRAHPLADPTRPAGLEVLGEEPVVMFSPVEARYFHELVSGAAEAHGVVMRPAQYVTQVHTMLALVEAGLGIALVPESASATAPDGVALRPIEGAPRAELVAAWRAGADEPALHRALALLPAEDQEG
jgi:DNA-binding transcriptional LysR family regulator